MRVLPVSMTYMEVPQTVPCRSQGTQRWRTSLNCWQVHRKAKRVSSMQLRACEAESFSGRYSPVRGCSPYPQTFPSPLPNAPAPYCKVLGGGGFM